MFCAPGLLAGQLNAQHEGKESMGAGRRRTRCCYFMGCGVCLVFLNPAKSELYGQVEVVSS